MLLAAKPLLGVIFQLPSVAPAAIVLLPSSFTEKLAVSLTLTAVIVASIVPLLVMLSGMAAGVSPSVMLPLTLPMLREAVSVLGAGAGAGATGVVAVTSSLTVVVAFLLPS